MIRRDHVLRRSTGTPLETTHGMVACIKVMHLCEVKKWVLGVINNAEEDLGEQ